MAKKKVGTIGLIKKGDPLPGKPKYKFDSAHLTEKSVNKRGGRLVGEPTVEDIIEVSLPKQKLIYVKRIPTRRKAPRITPKRPRLRR